jgi:hypothetical protein
MRNFGFPGSAFIPLPEFELDKRNHGMLADYLYKWGCTSLREAECDEAASDRQAGPYVNQSAGDGGRLNVRKDEFAKLFLDESGIWDLSHWAEKARE